MFYAFLRSLKKLLNFDRLLKIFPEKKRLFRVVVEGKAYNTTHSGSDNRYFTKIIAIPEGSTFEMRIGYDAIIGRDGRIIKVYDYIAGYELTKSFYYIKRTGKNEEEIEIMPD